MARRIVRARQKIVQAGIPYRLPRDEELDERLSEVLSVLYLMFNEGYLTSYWQRIILPRSGRGRCPGGGAQKPGPVPGAGSSVACHAEAESWEATDWTQILVLYDLLLCMYPRQLYD